MDREAPAPQTVAWAVERLRRGELIAAPSDTVYGLLCAVRADALERLTRIKGRPGPFLLLVPDRAAILEWTVPVGPELSGALDRVWPGPVTVVLRASARGREASGEAGIALRVPDQPLLRALLGALGSPLYSTSANPPAEPAPLRAVDIGPQVRAAVSGILDGGDAPRQEPSTLVSMIAPGGPRILRSGSGDASPLLDPALGQT